MYDPDSRILHGLLERLVKHLLSVDEGWLTLHDLAEHFALRCHEQLLAISEAAGPGVIKWLDARPQHGTAFETNRPLHAAWRHEMTWLWGVYVARS